MTDDVQDIKARIDIAGLIGETVRLKKAGVNFKGLCPFHAEKTPSFMVSPDRGTWHCFGCGEGGDAFEYVMKRENLDFAEALRALAARTGVQLKGRNPKDSQKKQRLFEANKQAAAYFQAALQHAAGKSARAYLAKRGLNEQTIRDFGIGYAPDSFDASIKALKNKGFTDEELVSAGVAGHGSRGLYARFRHRLMIPIADASGVIRGFTGRLLDDSAKEAKYVNTSETDIFHKGRLVFALDRAKQSMVAEGGCVLVEGQMDVLSAHQAGTTNVVATSGTALTEDQLRQLTRFSSTITMALDADSAGHKALMRVIELVGDRDIELKVADLGGAKDPDELIKTDPKKWKSVLEKAVPIIDYLLNRALTRHDPPYSRQAIKEVLADVIPALRFRAALDQDYYSEQLATALGVEKESIKEQINKEKVVSKAEVQAVPDLRHKTPEELVTERLIGLALTTEPLKPKLAAVDVRLFPEPYRGAAQKAQKGYTKQTSGDNDKKLLGVCALAAAEYEPMIDSERAAEFDRLLARLQLLWGKQYQPKLLAAIKRAEEREDIPERNRLMEEYTTLTKRISYAQK